MIKDVMVHLDGSAEDEIRLEHGQAIASNWRANLIGVYTNRLPDLAIATPMDGGAAMAQVLAELDEQARREGQSASRRLSQRLAALQVPTELRRIEESPGTLAQAVAGEARSADLFVATRPYRANGAPVWDDVVEAVLFGGGRGLLLVPPERHRRGSADTVLVAWNGSREAARAVREGLGFIEQATRTVVLLVDPAPGAEPGADIKRHLLHHGASVELAIRESAGRGIAEVILDEARRVSADLVVMGGYGHTRLRERVFGGATIDMLSASEAPLLLAH